MALPTRTRTKSPAPRAARAAGHGGVGGPEGGGGS